MKLSEAIRLGAMMHPQHFGALGRINGTGDLIGTCAIGAACEAAGIRLARLQDPWVPAGEAFPVLDRFVIPPFAPYRATMMSNAVLHLNDILKWSRERIADWVEEQEKLLESQTPQSTEQPEEHAVVA